MNDEAVGFCLCEVLIFLNNFFYSLKVCRNVCKITTDLTYLEASEVFVKILNAASASALQFQILNPDVCFESLQITQFLFLSCCFSFNTTTISKFFIAYQE